MCDKDDLYKDHLCHHDHVDTCLLSDHVDDKDDL